MTDVITDIVSLVPGNGLDGRHSEPNIYPYAIVTQRDCRLATTLGDRPLWHVTVDVMAVSNNPAGTRLYTRRVVDALDGQRIDGYRLTHVTSGPVLADRGDPTDMCWTCTSEFHITTPRRPRD